VVSPSVSGVGVMVLLIILFLVLLLHLYYEDGFVVIEMRAMAQGVGVLSLYNRNMCVSAFCVFYVTMTCKW
jgi:hypothetical protein